MSDFHASLVPQAANEMETYLRKTEKNSDMFFMLRFHSISNKQNLKKKMLTYPKIGSTISNKSKIKLFAVILNYRQDGSPSFRTQNAA